MVLHAIYLVMGCVDSINSLVNLFQVEDLVSLIHRHAWDAAHLQQKWRLNVDQTTC